MSGARPTNDSLTEAGTPVSETKNMATNRKAVVGQIDSLTALVWTIRKTDARRALELSMEARRLAQTESYDQGLAYSLRNMSESHYQIGDYKAGIADALEAVALFEKLEDKRSLASALHSLAKSIPRPSGLVQGAWHFLQNSMTKSAHHKCSIPWD
jgi:hypothetical protein